MSSDEINRWVGKTQWDSWQAPVYVMEVDVVTGDLDVSALPEEPLQLSKAQLPSEGFVVFEQPMN